MVKVADSTGEYDRSQLKRAADLAPDTETGTALQDAGIEGKDVVVVDFTSEERQGTDEKTKEATTYTLGVFTLEGGVTVHTSSKPVLEKMAAIVETNGDNCFPFLAMFTKERSKRNPRFSYWVMR